jgi:cytochrome c oxidase assembly factor 5
MSSSCQVLLTALKSCLLKSDCVVQSGHLPSECLKNKDLYEELPEQCKNLRQATFECKRGMVSMNNETISFSLMLARQLDMRKRFRGNNYGVKPEQFEMGEDTDALSKRDGPNQTPNSTSAAAPRDTPASV